MAHVGRTGLLQLLRGTGKPHETGRVPGSGACALVAYPSPSEPETPGLVDAHSCFGSAMASSTANAPSLSRRSLRRQSSEIRTGCANKRPSGSVRGATSDGCPYRDRQTWSPDMRSLRLRTFCWQRTFLYAVLFDQMLPKQVVLEQPCLVIDTCRE